MATAIGGLTGKNPKQVYSYVRGIQTILAAAVPFAAVDPAPAAVNTALATLNTYNNQMDLRYPVKALRDNALAAVVKLVNDQVADVNKIGAGDAAILGQSGYPLRKSPTPRGGAELINTLKLRIDEPSGSVFCSWSKSTNARLYRLRYSFTPDVPSSFVTVEQVFGRNYKLTGLTTGQVVYVQMQGISPAGDGPWSALAHIMVS